MAAKLPRDDARSRAVVLTLTCCLLAACGTDEPTPAEFPFCRSRGDSTATRAAGRFDLQLWGDEAKNVAAWEPFVVEVGADEISLEACSPANGLDWHFLGTWSRLATIPTEIVLDDDQQPNFRGELKGQTTPDGPFISSIFETVPVAAVAASGSGRVEAFAAGRFAGSLSVEIYEDSSTMTPRAGAELEFDLTF